VRLLSLSLFLTVLILSFVLLPVRAQERHPLTPEDLVNLRSGYDAEVSADGKTIAFVVSEPTIPNKPGNVGNDNIWIVPADGSKPAKRFASSPKSDYYPRWSPDGRWLAFLSDRGEDGQTQIWLMGTEGGEAQKLTDVKVGVSSFRWAPGGKRIAFMARDPLTDEAQQKQQRHDDAIEIDHDWQYTRLWVIDLSVRKSQLITRKNVEVKDFDWSPDGESFAVAYTATPLPEDWSHGSLAVVRRSDGEFLRNLADDVQAVWSSNIRWSPDGHNILFFERSPLGFASWVSLVDQNGGPVRPLLRDESVTFWACEWAADSRHVIGGAIVSNRVKLLRIDVATQQTDTLTEHLSGRPDFSVGADGRSFAYIAEKPDSPGEVWSLVAGQLPRQLTNLNPQVASFRLGSMREVSWVNRIDRRKLNGILVTPPDFKSGQPHPTIIQAHEGTSEWWVGWQGSWYQWAQLLASNGYVVFLPNPRGVMGEGWKSAEMAQNYNGGAYQDTMDGVESLIQQKIADPDRLGIGGWSNGGYMTAWAITHTDRFKAAVAMAAPVDFPLWWGTTPVRKYLEAVYGATPVRARQEYETHSPLYFAQNCKTPTLIIHGSEDTSVSIAQAYEFYRALKASGVETEMVVYPREGHYMQEPAHQVDLQKRILHWFDKYLK
jgi:dipeptidyl aminopeptidase/acylaminoacyl peptidase